ncbi:hypothetical protein V6N13_081027 [Hibiscus sabdariffa]
MKPDALDGKDLQYGSWLRVSTQQPRLRRRSGIEYFAASEPVPAEPTTVNAAISPGSTPPNTDPPPDLHASVAAENAYAAKDVHDAATMGTWTRDDLASASPTTVRSSKATDAAAFPVSDAATEKASHPAAPAEQSLSPTPVRSSKADSPEIPVGAAAPKRVSHPDAPAVPTVSAHVTELLQTEGGENKGTKGGLVSTLDHEAPMKAPSIATSSSRVSKRSLQGKYEVCTPIQPKRSCIGSCSGSDNKHAGMSSLNSSTEVPEVVGQPRRAS